VHAWSQQTPSGLQIESDAHPPAVAPQDWPRLLLHMPDASHVPGHLRERSSPDTIATQAWSLEHVWHESPQSASVQQPSAGAQATTEPTTQIL
jgi:hypothetical protein